MADTLLFVDQAAPYSPSAPYFRGYGLAGVHGVLNQAWSAVRQIASVAGLRAEHVEDVRDLDPSDLERSRAVVLFTIGETPWSSQQRELLTAGIRAGRLALAVVHSALDASLEWDDYGRLAGARFDGHPWTREFDAEVVDRSHPATAHLGRMWRCTDEVYTFHSLRPDAQVLLRIPPDQLDASAAGIEVPPFGYPVSWCHHEADGRIFATALGHFPACWESNDFLAHVAGGIWWTLRVEPGASHSPDAPQAGAEPA